MAVKDVEGEHRKAPIKRGLKAELQADTEKPVVWSWVVTQIWVIAGGAKQGIQEAVPRRMLWGGEKERSERGKQWGGSLGFYAVVFHCGRCGAMREEGQPYIYWLSL